MINELHMSVGKHDIDSAGVRGIEWLIAAQLGIVDGYQSSRHDSPSTDGRRIVAACAIAVRAISACVHTAVPGRETDMGRAHVKAAIIVHTAITVTRRQWRAVAGKHLSRLLANHNGVRCSISDTANALSAVKSKDATIRHGAAKLSVRQHRRRMVVRAEDTSVRRALVAGVSGRRACTELGKRARWALHERKGNVLPNECVGLRASAAEPKRLPWELDFVVGCI